MSFPRSEFRDPRLIDSYARAMLVEEIMALCGRASKDPVSYRRTLELFELSTLRRTRDELLNPKLSTPQLAALPE